MSDITPRALADFHARLRGWHEKHGRHALPWRNTTDAYAIYLSEIMLQQTQVETVLKRFYFPFLEKFPTLAALANADRAEVLKAWEGLGYYTRAANLHEAAKRSAPALPRSVEALCALPGVGRNTAHAVAAFAYHLPVAVMEANVKRVLHRIFARERANETLLWELSEALLDKSNPFDYNQAMMDIGALVCTKSSPACLLCPASPLCKGKDAPQRYPAPKAAKQNPIRRKNIVVARDAEGKIHATPRQTRFLQGLYHFTECDAQSDYCTYEGKKFLLTEAIPLGAITHTYSHFTLQAETCLLPLDSVMEGAHWHTPDALQALPWSQAEIKILSLLGRVRSYRGL